MDKRTWLIELLGGLAGGIVTAALGGLIGALLVQDRGTVGLVGSLFAMFMGFPLGVGGDMGLIDSRTRGHRQPWLGLVGAVLGIILTLLLAEPLGLNQNTILLLTTAIVTCCLASWAALNLPLSAIRRNK